MDCAGRLHDLAPTPALSQGAVDDLVTCIRLDLVCADVCWPPPAVIARRARGARASSAG